MTDNEKVEQARREIRQRWMEIENLVAGNCAEGSQLGRACDQLLDFTRAFAANTKWRSEATLHKGAFSDIEVKRRQGTESSDSLDAKTAALRLRVLDLTVLTAETAISAISQLTSDQPKIDESQAAKDSPLQASLNNYFRQNDSNEVCFRCRGLAKNYRSHGRFSLSDISLELRKGEITGVIGVNGSGKSTLLRMVSGVLQPDGGKRDYPSLACQPNNWAKIRSSVAFVPQSPERWSGTVEECLIRHAALSGKPAELGRHWVHHHVARLGLHPYRHNTWGQLSGGYRTRFELARALISQPRILVLDEPLAALDVSAQMQFLSDLRAFATNFGAAFPVLISSQHLYEIEAVADRMLVLNEGHAIFNDLTVHIGRGRKFNAFEVSSEHFNESAVEKLMLPRVNHVRRTGPLTFLLTTDLDCDSQTIVEALTGAQIRFNYFRDVSTSLRMFFD